MTLAKTQTHITSPSHSALGGLNSEIAPKKHPNSVSGSAQEAKELPPGNWERVILRLRSRDEPDKRGPPMVSIIGTGDPDTIPEEWWKLTPEEEAMWAEEEEVPEPLHETDDEAAEPALIAKPVSPPGRHAPPRPPRGSRFKPLTLNEIALLPPPEWLIDGLVPEDGLVVLYGEPAAGKSFVALDWGLCVATGVPWLGREVRSGEVVYIYAEGVRGLKRRAGAWLQAHETAEAPLFRAVPIAVTITDPSERSEFVRAVRSESKHPHLIIIDTLARNFGAGNESQAQDMNAFVKGCDELRAEFPGATVLVVHHSGKDQSRGARGSLALQGATEAVFALIRSGDGLTLKNEKQKDGEEAAPIALELARVQLPDGNTSRIIRSRKGRAVDASLLAPRKDPRTVRTDTGVLQALKEFGPEGATLAQWERAADRANDTFYKSRDRLVQGGKVLVDKENARYIAAEPKLGPGPGLVQDGSN